MAEPPIKKRLRLLGDKGDLQALKRAVTPPPAMVSRRLKTLVKTFGVDSVACLIDVAPHTIGRWLVRGDEVGPTCRKIIWTVYGMIYAPHELATLFDYATYGRFTTDPKGKPAEHTDQSRKRDVKGRYQRNP